MVTIAPTSNPAGRRLVWFAQCAGLPFTFYFFVVFLPFLPLSVPGLMIWGGGLLVLVPACVLLLHGFRVVAGFRKLRSEASGLLRWGIAFAALAISATSGFVLKRNQWIRFNRKTPEHFRTFPSISVKSP